MSDPLMIAIVASVAPTVLAIGTLVSSIINGKKADRIKTQGNDIHTLVNGDRQALRDELDRTRAELAHANATIARERLLRGHR